MRIFLAALSAATLIGCAALGHHSHSACDDLSGSYVMDPAACEMSRGLIQVPENVVSLMPDNSAMSTTAINVDIEQNNCEQLSLRSSSDWVKYDGARDEEGRFVVEQAAKSNLPTPIVLFSGGANTWTLERDGHDVIYVRRYNERGLFMLFMPYSAHREVTCRMRPATSG
ncbi:MAG TPA: hypothetical protein VN181_06545 [Thermoanaerobaculia bacterium]|nr:hypothetical protein [Thermoanaerobaculia bacterium]